MPVSQNYFYDHCKTLFNGESNTLASLQYVALSTSSDDIGSNAVITDVTKAFAAPRAAGSPTIQPFVPQDPEVVDDDNPLITPEILPYAEYPAPAAWTNDTTDTVTVRTLAMVAGDKLMFWGPVTEVLTVPPGNTYSPVKGIVLHITTVTNPDSAPSAFAGTDAVVVQLPYETINEREAAKHVSAAVTPHRLTWSDWTSSNPKIGERFLKAVKQLERLVYAIDGAPCVDGLQWYKAHSPRCNWFPEIRGDAWNSGCPNAVDGFGVPNCGVISYDFFEYPAIGSSYGTDPPHTPIRSRSGDWRIEMLDASHTHNRTYFPKLSVTRSDGAEVYDPRGSGDFGGDPTVTIGSDGPIPIDGEPVTITYTAPASVTLVGSPKLTYNGTTVDMAGGPLVWTKDIPAQNHNTVVTWYVEATFEAEPDNVTVREPADTHYTYTAYTHYVRYPLGFPSFYWSKDTDHYEFSGEETVQYELINMMRFILDYVAGSFNHSPSLRSHVPACCINIPILWRWSGANKWPLHRNGGKGTGVSPLHNLDGLGTTADSMARRSWRGFPAQFGENRYFPADEMEASWTAPLSFVHGLHRVGSQCVETWTGKDRGLQHDDVIEPVHVEELISAVDYLINNGLWNKCPIWHNPATPPSDLGLGTFHEHFNAPQGICGIQDWGDDVLTAAGGASGLDYRRMCFKTCHAVGDPELPPDWSWYLDYFGDCQYHTTGGWECEELEAPASWEACWEASNDICSWGRFYHKDCTASEGSATTWRTYVSATGICGGCYGDAGGSPPGGSLDWSCQEFFEPFIPGQTQACDTAQGGWDAYICGPEHNPNGSDDRHGNDRVKARYDEDCPNPNPSTTTVYSIGNQLGEVKICGKNWATGQDGMGFETVAHFVFEGWDNYGLCPDDTECDGGCDNCYECNEVDPPLGYNSWLNWADPPASMCIDSCSNYYDGDPPVLYEQDTSLFADVVVYECSDNYAWCSVDLGIAEGDEDKMPNLLDYDLGSAHLVTECPCETHGNIAACT